MIKNDIDIFREDIDEITISRMSEQVLECGDLLSHNMQYYFLARLNNFCLMMNAKGKTGYKEILFKNYKFIFDSGLYFSDDRSTISIADYSGILLSALKVKEFAWAESFIKKCKANGYLEDPDNISLYGLSFLSFYKGDFQKCIDLGNRVNLNFFALRLGVCKLVLKSMYEIGQFEEAKSSVANFKHFLANNNKKISKTLSSREILFLDYYLVLIKNAISPSKKNQKIILEKLETETSIADKEWLLSKFSPQKNKELLKNR